VIIPSALVAVGVEFDSGSKLAGGFSVAWAESFAVVSSVVVV